MLILRSKLIGMPIVDLRSQSRLGNIGDLILNDTDVNLSGIALRGNFGKDIRIILPAEVLEISKGIILVNDEDSITKTKDNIRINKLVNDQFYGIGQKVFTKSGKYIGRIHDLLIDSLDFRIAKFYVKSFLRERILSSNLILEIKGKRIIIKDDFELSRISQATEAARA